MEYKHKTFNSLAIRTRYAYSIIFIENADDIMDTKGHLQEHDTQTLVFTSARMALKVMAEIENDPNITLLEFKEILMHV